MNEETERCIAMSRSFGDLSFKPLGVCAVPDVSHCKIQKDTKSFAVLASDGLWDVFNEEQVRKAVELLRYEDHCDAQQVSELLCQKASEVYGKRRWDADDISVVVVFFD